MASTNQDHDTLISNFVEMTGATPEVATEYLSSSSWDFQSAVTEYYNPDNENSEDSAPPSNSAPQPIPTTSKMPPPPSNTSAKKKFATLGDISGNGGGAGSSNHNHEGDDSEDSDENQDLYAGGEKSGLAVENPDDLKKKIIERAKKNAGRPGGDEPRAAPSHFKGAARTLGGDDTPSEVIDDPNPVPPHRELVHRHLHFWEDGFSVDDGPLFRLDDPNNIPILAQIKQGRAPLSILNVHPGQEVDVKLEQHSEKYVQPKKKFKPFEGKGQRLGSPTPEIAGAGTLNSSASTVSNSAVTAPSTENSQPAISLNESEPTLSLQIRLGDGTRLVSRFNTSHTIGDVYDFVGSANASSRNRAWVLMTTFPSKELQERSQKLGDLAEFKRGGVVVQKWQ